MAGGGVTEKKGEEVDNRFFVPSIRSILYLLGFILIFALTVADLGLVSEQIHKYGRSSENYASQSYKNVLGLLLCAVIISLLICFFHIYLNLGLTAFLSLVLAIFFGVGAGIIRTSTPFRGTSCGRDPSEYPLAWQPYAHECSRIVSIQACSWSLYALYIFLLFGTLAYMFRISVRPTPGGYYASPSRVV